MNHRYIAAFRTDTGTAQKVVRTLRLQKVGKLCVSNPRGFLCLGPNDIL